MKLFNLPNPSPSLTKPSASRSLKVRLTYNPIDNKNVDLLYDEEGNIQPYDIYKKLLKKKEEDDK